VAGRVIVAKEMERAMSVAMRNVLTLSNFLNASPKVRGSPACFSEADFTPSLRRPHITRHFTIEQRTACYTIDDQYIDAVNVTAPTWIPG
jgi:hypothetical protein